MAKKEKEIEYEEVPVAGDSEYYGKQADKRNKNDDNDEDEEIDDRQLRKQVQEANRKNQKTGGFQSMGLIPPLFKAIQHMGYSFPTPIQRKSIPVILEGRDVVAMARTGSGKTAAFLIPMVNRLKCHSAKVGARGLVLSPSRELAMQTLKFTKDLCKHTDIRICALVGGDSMEEQFKMMASNPDIIIATPGRLMHLSIEMGLNFYTVEYVVFDEADRLFELGFAEQLKDILFKLPETRQTLLFSATLPRLLVDFARAGLSDPALIRLDADAKISKDMQLLFLSTKLEDKEATLLFLLNTLVEKDASVIVFTSTKHHVDYLQHLLNISGIPATYIYGALDQQARKIHLARFRSGQIKVMVVTDVAARGLDIPLLDYVINFDFPSQPKVFVHRVGRVARAGRKGTAISLMTSDEIPYLIDFHLFTGRPLKICSRDETSKKIDYKTNICLGMVPASHISMNLEHVNQVKKTDATLDTFYKASVNASKLYNKTKSSASVESYKRAKDISIVSIGCHPILAKYVNGNDKEQDSMLFQISQFRPHETIFEVGKRGANSAQAQVVKKRRIILDKVKSNRQAHVTSMTVKNDNRASNDNEESSIDNDQNEQQDYKDVEYFMSHFKADDQADKAYAIKTKPENFVEQAKFASIDLQGDEVTGRNKIGSISWDSKKHKFVRHTVGADNKKRIRTESGLLIPASYKTDRFQTWQKKTKIEIPRVGDKELPNSKNMLQAKRFKHNKMFEAKPFSHNANRKSREEKKPKGAAVPVKNELRNADQIRKMRVIKEKKKQRNARPTRKGRR